MPVIKILFKTVLSRARCTKFKFIHETDRAQFTTRKFIHEMYCAQFPTYNFIPMYCVRFTYTRPAWFIVFLFLIENNMSSKNIFSPEDDTVLVKVDEKPYHVRVIWRDALYLNWNIRWNVWIEISNEPKNRATLVARFQLRFRKLHLKSEFADRNERHRPRAFCRPSRASV